MKCPSCGLTSPDDALRCNCGYSFAIHRFYRSYQHMRVKDFFVNSWRTFGANWITFLVVAAIPTAVSQALPLAMGMGPLSGEETSPVTIIIVAIVSLMVWILSTMALTMAAHKMSDGQAIGIWESYTLSLGLFWRYIWTSILYFLIVMAGSILFIIPGIIFAVMYVFAPYAVMIEGLSGGAALSRSKTLTRGRLFGTFLLELGFGLFFLIVFAVPLLLLTLLIGQFFGHPLLAQTIQEYGSIVSEALFVIFNVLLFKSRAVMEMEQEASERTLANGSSAADLDALAQMYRSQGKHEEAKRLEDRATEIRSKS